MSKREKVTRSYMSEKGVGRPSKALEEVVF
jgi:hypothetical protein